MSRRDESARQVRDPRLGDCGRLDAGWGWATKTDAPALRWASEFPQRENCHQWGWGGGARGDAATGVIRGLSELIRVNPTKKLDFARVRAA